jgi:peptide-methionine (S)-S-oxide reductase
MTHVTSALMAASMVMLLGVLACGGCDSSPSRAEGGATASTQQPKATPGAAPLKESNVKTETALFGAGCFWGVESSFRKVPGVLATAVGYAGGTNERPTYEQVCTSRTGHAEVVQVVFDPAKVSYQQLLDVFFENHDPTTLNYQGPDQGTQYRSVIFYSGDEQKQLAAAEKAKRDKSGEYVGPIVTSIDPAPTFWKAEDYHQQYFEKQGVNWSCHTGNGKKRKVSLW